MSYPSAIAGAVLMIDMRYLRSDCAFLLPTSYFLLPTYYLLLANFCPLTSSKCYRWASSPLISDRRAIGRLAPSAARCVLGYMLAPSCELAQSRKYPPPLRFRRLTSDY